MWNFVFDNILCFLSSTTICVNIWSDNCNCGSSIYKNALEPLNVVGSYLGISSLANKSCILIEFTRIAQNMTIQYDQSSMQSNMQSSKDSHGPYSRTSYDIS